MAYEDFDIDSLAAYLHLAPHQVSKLADRGKLPGRKISGHWRFARAEVHHWLEHRIGLSDEDELVEVEGVLQRSAGAEAREDVCIAELLPVEAIAVPLQARTRGSVIQKMADLAAQTGMLWDPDKMAQVVRDRENLHPTALDIGVALLHPRRPMPNDVAHFAIHADDCQRAKTFYEKTFGWTFEPWGPPDFWRVFTSPGAIHGALQKRREPIQGAGMIGYECSISVVDVRATAEVIAANGGTVTMQPFEIEGVGTLVMFQDTEGNVVGAMQYVE